MLDLGENAISGEQQGALLYSSFPVPCGAPWKPAATSEGAHSLTLSHHTLCAGTLPLGLATGLPSLVVLDAHNNSLGGNLTPWADTQVGLCVMCVCVCCGSFSVCVGGGTEIKGTRFSCCMSCTKSVCAYLLARVCSAVRSSETCSNQRRV